MSKERFKWPIVGHKNIADYLQNSIINNRVAHAYLFFGPAGIGKTVMAESFVTSLVCARASHSQGFIPCGECDCCRQIAGRIHPDMVWLERETEEKTGKIKKNISIEQIRELKNKLSLRPFLDSYKVAIVSNAQNLSQEAANALLKTLEEPTPKTVIILLTDNILWLPLTIISRCQVLKFLPVSQIEIVNHLIDRGADKKLATRLSALSYGRPGIAINYFSDPDLWQTQQQQVKDFLALSQLDILQKLKFVQSAFTGADLEEIFQTINVWIKAARDLILIKTDNGGLIANLPQSSELEKVAAHYPVTKLSRLLRELNLAKKYLAANVNPRLILDNLILNF